jgi:hypothetical protein
LILSAFELLSGLKINFHKSELYWFWWGSRSDPVVCWVIWLQPGWVSS